MTVSRKSAAGAAVLVITVAAVFMATGCEPLFFQHSIFLTTLQDGDEVWGIVKLVAEVSGKDVSSVTFYCDTVDEDHVLGAGTLEGSSHYTVDWYTQEGAQGEHAVYAVVRYGDGESLQDSVRVTVDNPTRADSIPADTVKLTPENDPAPPQLMPEFKDYWHDPVPLEGPINTAGAEDSPFITPDGGTFYFWFKGDVTMDVHDEVYDPASGIYWAQKVDGQWQEPEKVNLQYYDQLSLDGAHTVRGNTMWFASVREGNYRDIDIWTATLADGRWSNWTNAGKKLNLEYEIGELHVSADGSELYFDSSRAGGKGGKDIWVTRKVGGEWQDPESITIVNTELMEGWPYVSEDGRELWFTRATPGPEIYRSFKVNGQWQEPQKVIAPMAGEPTLDNEGNIYFAHHWWNSAENRANEADFYVCYRR